MITKKQFVAAINTAFAAIKFPVEASVISSVKTGKDAQKHTDSPHCSAYFCIEESLVRDLRDMFPSTYGEWEDALHDALKPYGLYAEPINSVEFALYA